MHTKAWHGKCLLMGVLSQCVHPTWVPESVSGVNSCCLYPKSTARKCAAALPVHSAPPQRARAVVSAACSKQDQRQRAAPRPARESGKITFFASDRSQSFVCNETALAYMQQTMQSLSKQPNQVTTQLPLQGTLIRLLQNLAATAAISFWMSQIMINTVGTMVACCLLCYQLNCLPAAIFLLLEVSTLTEWLALATSASNV